MQRSKATRAKSDEAFVEDVLAMVPPAALAALEAYLEELPSDEHVKLFAVLLAEGVDIDEIIQRVDELQ